VITERCSRAGCTEPATTRIEWRNPRIHDVGRTKVWLACDGHRDYLVEFLEARAFPVRAVGMQSPE
jgi:hypothetical protein